MRKSDLSEGRGITILDVRYPDNDPTIFISDKHPIRELLHPTPTDVTPTFSKERTDTFKIARSYSPDKEVWVDPHAPVFNQKKHDATCLKNRRKRKKRRRK